MSRRKVLVLLIIALLAGGALTYAQAEEPGAAADLHQSAVGQATGPVAWVQELFDWLVRLSAPATPQEPAQPPGDEPAARRHDQGSPVPDGDQCGGPSPGGSTDECGPYLDPDG